MDCLRESAIVHPRLESLDVSFCKYLNRSGLLGTLHGCPSMRSVDIAWCAALTPMDVFDFVRFSVNLRSVNVRGFPPMPSHAMALFQSRGIEVVK